MWQKYQDVKTAVLYVWINAKTSWYEPMEHYVYNVCIKTKHVVKN